VNPSSPPLELHNVTIRLGGAAIVEAASATLHAGDLVLLSGPNGAGKSTLLRAIANLLPAQGDILISGFHPGSLQAKARFVFVPDEAALYEDLTLREHVRFMSMIYGQPQAEERILTWLDMFGLHTRLEEFPSTHSRGMRQKLALALALGLDTPLLLLDEPYNGLDTDAQARLTQALQERSSAGGAVLLTGHQAELKRVLTAWPLVLRDGMLDSAPADAGTTPPDLPHAR
jgi:ABC-2 type transport system ATP-binding protein